MNYFEETSTSKDDLDALTDFLLGFIRIPNSNFQTNFLPTVRTWFCHRPMTLQYEHKLTDKAFFIARGFVFSYFYSNDQEIVAFRIFKEGEVALIPESFTSGNPALYSLMACANTRLLEISLTQDSYLYQLSTDGVIPVLQIVSLMFAKDVEKDKMLSLGRKESIRRFYELYPDLFGNTSFQFRDMYIARHLNMNPVTFSRLRSQLFPYYPFR